MKRFRIAGLILAVLAVLSAGSVQAGGELKYGDEAGDALDGRASMDIVSVTHDVRQINKSGPPSLVLEMELAAPPEAQLASYEIRANVDGCGFFQASYTPGTAWGAGVGSAPASFFIECGSPADSTGSTATLLDAQFRIDGNTLRWSGALDSIPKELRSNVTFTDIHSFTQIAEPFMGINGSADANLPMDDASTSKAWSYTGI